MSEDILLARDTSTGYFDFVIEDGDAMLIDSTEGSVLTQIGSDRRADASADMFIGESRGFVHEDLFPSLVYGSLAWTILTQSTGDNTSAVMGFTRDAVSQVADIEDIKLQVGFIGDELSIFINSRKVI